MMSLANTADAKALLENIRISNQSLETRMVLDLTESVNYKIFTLNRPNRIVIDLYKTDLSPDIKSARESGLIEKIRIAKNSRTKTRIVIETREIVFYKVEKIAKGSNKNFRVVVDLKKGYEGSRKLVASSVNRKELIVAIDPGHGGRDAGSTGPSGLKEKDLVLSVSTRLKELLERRLGLDVTLTRTDDSFVPLEERTAIANKLRADLFLSIHANATRDRRVTGVETFFLNFSSNADERAVATRENAGSQKNIRDLEDMVKGILLALKTRSWRKT